jgi:hypothetical protein
VSLLPNGKVGYQTKKGQALELTPEKFVSRLAALIPRKGMHLTVGYGVFASAHSLRDKVMKAREVEKPTETQEKLPFEEKKKQKPSRRDWAELQRRTFLEDVLKCPCGGTRRILAVVTHCDEALASLKGMGVELSPSDIRETGPPPPPLPDTQLRLYSRHKNQESRR